MLNGVKHLIDLTSIFNEMLPFGQHDMAFHWMRGLFILESGRKHPSLELAVEIADYFGVSLDQLARDELELE
jgi:hypothetical protein